MPQLLIFGEAGSLSWMPAEPADVLCALLCLDKAAFRFLPFQSAWVTPQMSTGQTGKAHLYLLWLTLRTIGKNKGETWKLWHLHHFNCATELDTLYTISTPSVRQEFMTSGVYCNHMGVLRSRGGGCWLKMHIPVNHFQRPRFACSLGGLFLLRTSCDSKVRRCQEWVRDP